LYLRLFKIFPCTECTTKMQSSWRWWKSQYQLWTWCWIPCINTAKGHHWITTR
jgi:hypothetical protein